MSPETTVTLRSGNEMPVLGLGTWQLTTDTSGTVSRALELGYRMIDTSGDYGTQPGIGEALRKPGPRRESVFVVTKVEETENAFEATRRNLGELGLQYADLVLIHRPPDQGVGADLWEGLMRAKEEGLARDIGVSNYTIPQIRELVERSGETPAVNQIEWSPFGHGEQMLDFCRDRHIVIQAYSPLTRAQRLNDARLKEIASRYGKQPAQLLIRWNLQRGTVPLPKANREDHLQQDIAVFDFEIGEEDMKPLDGLNEHFSSLSFLPYV